MAVTSKITRFATEDLKEFHATSGTIAWQNSVTYDGNGCIKITGQGGQSWGRVDNIAEFGAGLNVNPFSFTIRFDDVTPASDFKFLILEDSFDDPHFNLTLKSNGDIELQDENDTVLATATPSLTNNQFHRFDIYLVKSSTGAFECNVDGAVLFDESSVDIDNGFGGAAYDHVKFLSGGATGEDVYLANFYKMDAATSVNDFFTDFTIHFYTTDKTGSTPDEGTGPNNGVYQNINSFPINESNEIEYTASGPVEGRVYMDGASGGPNADTSFSGVVQGITAFFWSKRGGGASTTHKFQIGGVTSGTVNINITLDNSFSAIYFSRNTGDADLPDATDDIEIGAGIESGNQDHHVAAWGCYLLATPERAAIIY